MNIINIKDVGFSYKNTDAIGKVSFSVRSKEFVSIIGPSGCGKSTLLRIIAGLIVPTRGKVFYMGKTLEESHSMISFVFQDFALLPWLTNIENIMIGFSNFDMEEKKKRIEAMKLIDLFGLSDFEDFYPNSLSGGMKQRVGIARATASKPDVLLMDEPFSALDVLTANALRSNVRDLLYDKDVSVKSVVMVTHNVDEAVELSNKIIILSESPAKVKKIMRIGLSFPRKDHKEEFERTVDSVYSVLTE